MKIGILHLSDIHIKTDSLLERIQPLVDACRYDVEEIARLYIVISGDVVQSGSKDEFQKAIEFINNLKSKIKPKQGILQIEVILIPGNHDCCFVNEDTIRNLVVSNSRKEDFIEDRDFFRNSLSVQENYWEFYQQVIGDIQLDKISFKIESQPHINQKVVFHCYNSSWMSQMNEGYGDLIIPENKFLKPNNGEFIISIMHHPLEWLSPKTKRNNKERFSEHLVNSSNMVLFGHEHDKGHSKNVTTKSNNVVFCGGKAFYSNDKSVNTGFAFYEIDFEKKSINAKIFNWNKDCYGKESTDTFFITDKVDRKFQVAIPFAEKINSLNVPLKHYKKQKLLLSDVFVYPDLEPIKEDPDGLQYPNSKQIIDEILSADNAYYLLEGDDQSGKTTLLFSLYRNLISLGYNPLYIRGKNVKSTNVKDLTKKAIKEQYTNKDAESFLQEPKRIFIIDNFHKSNLNSKFRKVLLENLRNHYDYLIITADNSIGSNLTTDEATILKDFSKYKILPLGHEKRGELIEQWLRLGEDEMTISEELILKNIRTRFDEINSLLGNRLMPSYPIFILTLLQGLDAKIIDQDYSQTSYAHVYYALITSGLVREGVKDSTALSSYLNILKELAFFLYERPRQSFTKVEFEKFYIDYEKAYYRDYSSDLVLNMLTQANIIKEDDGTYHFSYKYIFYYLVAQKIASKIDQYENLIEGLCENIHEEKNANILIFLSHHSKAQSLIDNIVFTSELPFENATPVTLDRDDEFVSFITDFVSEVKSDIIEERNPEEEVKKDLRRKDKKERSIKELKEDGSIPTEMVEISQAHRSIKIIGQIVKNQKGDFEKEKLKKLVHAAYNTSFRFVGFFAEILERDKDQIIETITGELNNKTKEDKTAIEKSVRKFLQYVSWRVCMDSFTGLMFSVGTKGRNELYDSVAKEMDTTSAKIVSFAIKTYYESINVEELKSLFEETEGNYLAQCILRVYIKKHIYTNIIKPSKKDQIIKIVGFRPQAIVRRALAGK